MDGHLLFTPACRIARAAERAAGKAVTLIVTLAATRTVTLAARAGEDEPQGGLCAAPA